MIKGCELCGHRELWHDEPWCYRWGVAQSGVLGPCAAWPLTEEVVRLEAAVRDAGLEERYVAKLIEATGIDAELWLSNVDGEAELTNAIAVLIALAALTPAQRSMAAQKTLEKRDDAD